MSASIRSTLLALAIACVATLGCPFASSAQWQRVHSPRGGGTIVQVVACDSSLLAIMNYSLMRSTDNGAHWLIDSTVRPTQLWRMAVSGRRVYIGGPDSAYFSTDGGGRWRSVQWPPERQNIVALAFVNDTIYASDAGNTVFRSTDLGASWDYAASGMDDTPNDFAVIGNEIFSAGEIVRQFNSSTQEWDSATTGLVGHRFNSICSVADTLYVGGDSGVFRSIDLGHSWMRLPGAPTSVSRLSANEQCLLAARASQVFESLDGGATWQLALTAPQTILSILVRDTFRFACPNQEGVLRSSVHDTAWTSQGAGLAELGMMTLAARGGRIYATNGLSNAGNEYYIDGNAIFSSDDGCATWTRADSGSASNHTEGLFVDGGVLYSWNYNALYRSTTDNVWTRVGPDPMRINVMVRDRDRLFAYGWPSLYRSSDDGATWIAANNGIQGTTMIAGASNGRFLFVGTTEYVFRSSDFGNSWERADSGLPQRYVGQFITPVLLGSIHDTVYAWIGQNSFQSHGRLYRSTNDGVSWAVCDSVLPAGPTRFVTDGSALIGAGPGGVFIKRDGHSLVTAVNAGIDDSAASAYYQIYDICIAGGVLYAAGQSGIWRRPLAEIESDITASHDISIPNNVFLANNFPNPFTTETSISFELPIATHVRLSVCDAMGREIAVVSEGQESAGNHVVHWNASGLRSGVYIYRLAAGGVVRTGVMVVVR